MTRNRIPVGSGEGLVLRLDNEQVETASKAEGGVAIGIRPEHIQVSMVQRDGSLPASVYVTVLMGQ